MPLTLFRYILKDVAKLLALTTGVLVMVMSVGFVIITISKGSLEALTLLKLIFFVMPGMLTYALPIAAAFSATMVYFRLSADSEIVACAVSGISYRWILMPVAMLGVGLTLAMFFLANWIIPIFWQQVEQLIQRDVAQMVVEQIDSQQVVEFGNFVVYADHAEFHKLPPPPDRQPDQPWPYQRIVLEHAAGGKLDANHNLDVDYTGELAVADFYHYQDKTYATIKFTNATVKDPASGLLVSVREQNFLTQEIPNFFRTRPRFLSWNRLAEMSTDPDQHKEVADAAQALREAIVRTGAMNQLKQGLAGRGAAVPPVQADANAAPSQPETFTGGGVLNLSGPQGEDYTVQAGQVRVEGDHLQLLSSQTQPVVVQIGGLNVQQRLEAQSGRMEVIPSTLGAEPRINLKLSQVTVHDPHLPTTTSTQQVKTRYLTMLRLPQPLMGPLRDMKSLDLLQEVEQHPVPGSKVLVQRLIDQINELFRDIHFVVNERAAMAVCTMLVMLLGASMSMWLRDETPLVIFFWCFLPTIVAILLMSGVRNVIRSDLVGLGSIVNSLMVWSGDMVLIGVTGVVYRKLCRH